MITNFVTSAGLFTAAPVFIAGYLHTNEAVRILISIFT